MGEGAGQIGEKHDVRIAGEGRGAAEALVEHAAEREEIGAGVDVLRAAGLLGGHEIEGAHQHVGAGEALAARALLRVVDAGEANWPSEMTTASPANEPETIPPAADPTVVVSEAGGGDSALSLAAIPVADHSKPNPICRDPDDCGVYASWHLTCEACKRADAHRVAA